MGSDVFANGREIACKSGDGKVLAAFPDVCFTPPETPGTPTGVPVPYPVTSFSTAEAEGTRSVRISGREAMLRNLSYYKKCIGDEAGAAAKKGMITSSNGSKTYFKSWSMDVRIEGYNVARHFDITTSNHRSDPGNESIPFPEIESMALSVKPECAETYAKFQLHRHGNRNCRGSRQQSHHPVMNACFQHIRGKVAYGRTRRYRARDCPAVCITNSRKNSSHYRISKKQNKWARSLLRKPNPTYKELRAEELKNLKLIMQKNEAECIMIAVDMYMETIGVNKDTVLRKPGIKTEKK